MEKITIDKNLFFSLVNLLEAYNLFFWLDFGTLLGAYRDKAFITNDDDIDISLWVVDYWKVRQIIDLSDWKYKAIWRRELSIYHPSNPNAHIDLFFYDNEQNCYSSYVYLENKLSHKINVESKMTIPLHLLTQFKTIKFYNREFNIPKNTEEYLTCHYGNWKEKDLSWYYSKRINIDRNHSLIGIIIPTFLRDEKLKICIESLLKLSSEINRFQPFFRIYIGDQAEISYQKQAYYQSLEDLGHKYYQLPYNCGLSYARNFLISKTKEPFILISDDDYEFTQQTFFEPLINLLLLNENIGIVGGTLNDRETHPTKIYIDKSKYTDINRLSYIVEPINYQITKPTITQPNEYRYFSTEIIPNFFLSKKEIYNDISWDNELKLVEHSDFFLRLKTTKWKTLFTPDSLIQHHSENNSEIYDTFRNSKTGKNCLSGLTLLKKKYNITTNNLSLYTLPIENKMLTPTKIKIVQLARIPCANSGLELNNLLNKYSENFQSRYILGTEYSEKNPHIPYRKFPMDLYWQTQKDECLKELQEADIIHIHHDIIKDDKLVEIIKNKKTIWTLYNLSQSLQYENNTFNRDYINKCRLLSDIITVADQSAQRKLFSDITDIKVPLIKMLFDYPFHKPNEIPLIVFAPTNKKNISIASKKYDDVMSVIKELQQEGYIFNFDLIEGVPYEENLERKSKADILIDDVDPEYEKFHNSSIEGACFGSVVLTNYSGNDYPFFKTNIFTLKSTLIDLITKKHFLLSEQEKMKIWKNTVYQPSKLLQCYEQLYYDVLHGKYFLKEQIKDAEPIALPNNTSQKDIICSIINYLNSNNITFWLLKESCLETVTKKELISKTLHIGVHSLVEKNIILNKFMQYTSFLDITIEPIRDIKSGYLYDLKINIPLPVIKYLEKYTRKSWNEIIRNIQ